MLIIITTILIQINEKVDTKLLTDRRTDRQTDGQTCEHKVFPNTLDDLKKTEEVIRQTRFSIIWLMICELLPWQHPAWSLSKKCVMLTDHETSIYYEFHENCLNIEEAVLQRRIFPYILHKFRYHGNALFATAKICVLHIDIFRRTSVPNFMKNYQYLREEFATQELSPFCP